MASKIWRDWYQHISFVGLTVCEYGYLTMDHKLGGLPEMHSLVVLEVRSLR